MYADVDDGQSCNISIRVHRSLCFDVDVRLAHCFRFNKMQAVDENNRTEQIEQLCDPCTRFFVNKKFDTITDGKDSDEYKEFARFVESLPAVCAKNANGQRCGLLADENVAGTSPLTAVGMRSFMKL